MNQNTDKSTGISAKCLKGMARFLGASGKIYPCCFVYTNHKDWNAWCEKYGVDKDANDLNTHTHEEFMENVMDVLVKSNFDMETCVRECGVNGYDTEMTNQPKFSKFYPVERQDK